MRSVKRIADLKEALRPEREAGKSIGFVPTMGALHDGHLALVRAAREECDVVVVSIFVNPTQFDRRSDFSTYPRGEARDTEIAAGAGVDVLFTPDADEMYLPAYSTYVHVEDLSELLCGSVRPGHFKGVASVIAKFFGIVEPDVAYFGEKDYQQLVVVRRMVADLNMGVRIAGVPTVREPDGLAMSSRNVLLGANERRAAALIYRALSMAKDMVARESIGPHDVVECVRRVIGEEPLVRIEYLNVVNPETLRDLSKIEGPAIVAIAAYLGNVRLIDNVMVGPGS